MDAYGVGVRAGMITPVPEDEIYFRSLLGFPPITDPAKKDWAGSGDVRKPITLVQTGIVPPNPPNEDPE